MNKETLERANLINKRIINLKGLKKALEPKDCKGIGIRDLNNNILIYKYNISKLNTNINNNLIMKVGVNAMYSETCRLLRIEEETFKTLKS